MKTILKITMSFFIAAIIFTGCTKQKQQKSLTIEDGVLTVGLEAGYPPMEYYSTDGITLAGFDIDLTKALAEKLGMEVKYIDTAWEGILAGLDTYRYDIAVNVTVLPERQKKYNFTKPYIESSMTIMVLKDSLIKIERPQDIAGYRAGFQGDTTAQFFTENLAAQGIKFSSYSYDKITNCFNDLNFGRLDLIVIDNIVAFDIAGKENSLFETAWQGQADELISICLKKDNDALTDALNNALDELFSDGTMLKISQKIFSIDMVSSVRK